MSNNNAQNRLDQATSDRLAKLAHRPVDTSRLERRLVEAMREEVVDDSVSTQVPAMLVLWQRYWRPVISAAAILIVTALGWLVLNGSNSPAMAAPAELAQIHFDVANGLSPHLMVSSVEQANQLLADQANGVVPVPNLPGLLKSCCLHQLAGTTLTCALIERDGQLITVAIAHASKLHSPKGKSIVRDGKRYTAHTTNGINMVMTHDDDRWLCVMGEATTEQLLDVATEIAF